MGRPFGTKKIETPERLMELFEQYKAYIKANPFLVQDYVGKDGVEVFRTKEKPLTIDGFETWLYENSFIGDLSHYFANTNGSYADYLTICHAIRKACRNDQINGGMAGIYNPSITQRLNGLTEKVQNEQNININKMKEENQESKAKLNIFAERMLVFGVDIMSAPEDPSYLQGYKVYKDNGGEESYQDWKKWMLNELK